MGVAQIDLGLLREYSGLCAVGHALVCGVHLRLQIQRHSLDVCGTHLVIFGQIERRIALGALEDGSGILALDITRVVNGTADKLGQLLLGEQLGGCIAHLAVYGATQADTATLIAGKAAERILKSLCGNARTAHIVNFILGKARIIGSLEDDFLDILKFHCSPSYYLPPTVISETRIRG